MRSHTVLVAEDHNALRSVLVDTLRQAGFHVLQAGDGLEAVQAGHAWHRQGSIDLLVSDIDMPFLPGPAVSVRLSEMYPAMRTLYVTGRERHTLGVLTPGAAFLLKPFTRATLLTTVLALLDSETADLVHTTGRE